MPLMKIEYAKAKVMYALGETIVISPATVRPITSNVDFILKVNRKEHISDFDYICEIYKKTFETNAISCYIIRR